MLRCCSAFLFCTSFLVVLAACLLGPTYKRLQTRSTQLERQDKSPDEGHYTIHEFKDLMRILAEANRADRNGYNLTLEKFAQLRRAPNRILEIGFGMGDFSIQLARAFPGAAVQGIDAHELSVKFAEQNLAAIPADEQPQNLHFRQVPAAELNEPEGSVDVVTTTFVNHHIFPDAAFVDFLRLVKRTGRQAFVFNDLIRSFPCYMKAVLLMSMPRYGFDDAIFAVFDFFRLPLLRNAKELSAVMRPSRSGFSLASDGATLSVARSFTMDELIDVFRLAGFPDGSLNCSIRDSWFDAGLCRVACYAALDW